MSSELQVGVLEPGPQGLGIDAEDRATLGLSDEGHQRNSFQEENKESREIPCKLPGTTGTPRSRGKLPANSQRQQANVQAFVAISQPGGGVSCGNSRPCSDAIGERRTKLGPG